MLWWRATSVGRDDLPPFAWGFGSRCPTLFGMIKRTQWSTWYGGGSDSASSDTESSSVKEEAVAGDADGQRSSPSSPSDADGSDRRVMLQLSREHLRAYGIRFADMNNVADAADSSHDDDEDVPDASPILPGADRYIASSRPSVFQCRLCPERVFLNERDVRDHCCSRVHCKRQRQYEQRFPTEGVTVTSTSR